MIDTILATTEGWLFRNEALMLAKYASLVKSPSVVVEIGGYRARSTLVLATSSVVPVYSIDPHTASEGDPYQFGSEDRAQWTRNILAADVADRVLPVNLRSDQITNWDVPIGFLFIDGCHSLECVRSDLKLWIPRLAPDGLLAIHDGNWPAVIQAVSEFPQLEVVETADITTVYQVRQ